MKLNINSIFLIFIMICFCGNVYAQTPYEIKSDPETGSKIYKGSINKYTLINDSSFTWYKQGQESYSPDLELIKGLEKYAQSVQFVVFGGTWCDDSQYIMPRFFELMDKSGIADSSITLFGVDRKKQSTSNLSEALNITRVPTILVFKNGKEMGRIVEYGTTGKWDQEMVDLLPRN
jgi:thiol-disulfide isomerase/thioredoxin